MKRIVFIAGFVMSVAAGTITVSVLSAPKAGTMETFSHLHDARLGSAYIRGRYDGFLNGWDVAFFYRDNEGRWLAYYLAHESRGWGKASLRIEGNLVVVNKGTKKVAEYDTQSGVFTHKLQGMTYTKQEGLEGAVEATRRTHVVKPPETTDGK